MYPFCFRDALVEDAISTEVRRLDCSDIDLFICIIASNARLAAVGSGNKFVCDCRDDGEGFGQLLAFLPKS